MRRVSDGNRQRLVDGVAAVTRAATAEASPAALHAGWHRLERALDDGRYPSVPITKPYVTPFYLRGIVFVSLALGAGMFADWTRYQREMAPLAPLHFVLEGAEVQAGQRIEARADAPAELVFSDWSHVTLAPNAKITLLAMDGHGARVALASGDLDVSVTPRNGSTWRFEAGPFTVAAKGTEFHLGFEAARGRLALRMREGVAEIEGPAQRHKFILRAGESLELFASATTAMGAASAPVRVACRSGPVAEAAAD
jgi:ferric-dicitrate binding protein FerR (iron transport regulator)